MLGRRDYKTFFIKWGANKVKEFTTTEGKIIKYGPIALADLELAKNAVEAEFRARGEPLDPPTYEVPVLGGEVEHHPYTEKSIEDGTEEEKAQWDAYKDAIGRLETEIEHRTAYIFLDAMHIELPEDDRWIKRRKRLFNEDVPTDEDEQLLYYANNVLLKTPADKNGIMEEILVFSMTGVPEEVVEAYKSLFRRSIREEGQKAVALAKAIQGTGDTMDVQPVDAASDDSQGMGDATEPVS